MNFTSSALPNFHMNSQSSKREERLPAVKRLFESIDHSVAGSGNKLLSTSSQQPQLPTPPELLHDSEEDDEESLSTPSLSLSPKQSYMKDQQINIRPNYNKNRSYSHSYVRPLISFSQQARQQQQQRHRRKSVPYKSPSVVLDPFQASLFDKSIVFQLNVLPHNSNNHQSTIISSSTTANAVAETVPMMMNPAQKGISRSPSSNQTCPDCGDACDFKCTSEVICGQSLLSALRKRVAHARTLQQQQQQQQQQEASLLQPRLLRRKRTRAASIIEIPRSHRRSSASSEHSNIITTTTTTTTTHTANAATTTTPTATADHHTIDSSDDIQHYQENNHQYHHYGPPPAATAPANVIYPNQQQHPTWIEHEQYPSFYSGQENTSANEDQHQTKRFKKIPTTPRRQSSHGVSSGRPSRVKGPCQACQEASDGCMRKAFDWPFPASQAFNDKGKPFVYLCNKCGLRYNKSGGCVCRHCRWVFCKEEKRKALQHIEAMRRNRPDGYVDPDEDIENFVCSPKYWTCGKPWKVGWVLNNVEEEEEEAASMNNATTVSTPVSVHV